VLTRDRLFLIGVRRAPVTCEQLAGAAPEAADNAVEGAAVAETPEDAVSVEGDGDEARAAALAGEDVDADLQKLRRQGFFVKEVVRVDPDGRWRRSWHVFVLWQSPEYNELQSAAKRCPKLTELLTFCPLGHGNWPWGVTSKFLPGDPRGHTRAEANNLVRALDFALSTDGVALVQPGYRLTQWTMMAAAFEKMAGDRFEQQETPWTVQALKKPVPAHRHPLPTENKTFVFVRNDKTYISRWALTNAARCVSVAFTGRITTCRLGGERSGEMGDLGEMEYDRPQANHTRELQFFVSMYTPSWVELLQHHFEHNCGGNGGVDGRNGGDGDVDGGDGDGDGDGGVDGSGKDAAVAEDGEGAVDVGQASKRRRLRSGNVAPEAVGNEAAVGDGDGAEHGPGAAGEREVVETLLATVLDTHGGQGTTAKTCAVMFRNSITCECDEGMFLVWKRELEVLNVGDEAEKPKWVQWLENTTRREVALLRAGKEILNSEGASYTWPDVNASFHTVLQQAEKAVDNAEKKRAVAVRVTRRSMEAEWKAAVKKAEVEEAECDNPWTDGGVSNPFFSQHGRTS